MADNLVVASCTYRHPHFGVVRVKVNARSRRVAAHWEGAELVVVVPKNFPVADYNDFLNSRRADIVGLKPQARYAEGIIDGNFADFEIRVDPGLENSIKSSAETERPQRGKLFNGLIRVAANVIAERGFSDYWVDSTIHSYLRDMAFSATGLFLLPHARELAAKVGHAPVIWDVKHSRTRLGCCSSKGVITLSPRLIFLPIELADAVIYHELAHLSEMNHSEAFHRICNAYCGGREAQYRAAIRAFAFPIK